MLQKLRMRWSRWRENERQYQLERALYKAGAAREKTAKDPSLPGSPQSGTVNPGPGASIGTG
jgi:hypothetical protein